MCYKVETCILYKSVFTLENVQTLSNLRFITVLVLLCLPKLSNATKPVILGANEKLVEQYAAQYILQNIYQKLAVDMQVIPLPPARAKKANLAGDIDGEIARIKPYGYDKPSLQRIEPHYYYLESAAYCRKDSALFVNTPKDLLGLEVATIRGVAHSNEATKNLYNVYQVNTAMQLFELLKRKRVDVVIDTEINGRRILQDKSYAEIRNCGVFAKFALYNYLNSNQQHLHEKIAKKIEQLKSSGKLQKLINTAEKKALTLPDSYF